MNEVIIATVGLLKEEKPRKDGKQSRKFFSLGVFDAKNPLASATRNVFQRHDAEGKAMWKNGIDLHMVYSSLLGKPVNGAVVRGEVKPYKIGEREVTHYTGVVFTNETFEQVAKENGHEMLGATIKAEKAEVKSELIGPKE